ncbi:MAG: class I SAM-dependent methyltransferase [Bacillota bacterium]
MKVLKGNALEDFSAEAYKAICSSYKNIYMDIGTGDGSFSYRKASKDKAGFYIGLDAVADNMLESSKRAGRKVTKGGLDNVMFVICDALDMPEELSGSVDSIHINLPWGSLRDSVVKGEEKLLRGLTMIAKKNAALEVYVTYSPLYETKEINLRLLPELSLDYINAELKRKYSFCGINIKKAELCSNEGLKSLDTQWAKKLAYGRKRDIYYLSGIINQTK